MPALDEMLALDVLTLREHTELAGDAFDVEAQRQRISKSLEVSEVVAVRDDNFLIAYAMLRPDAGDRWFVLGFNVHPEHRNGRVFRHLFAQIAGLARRRSITSLRSNVYKTNRLSMTFHRRLGFTVTRENSKGVEFTADLADVMSASPAVARARQHDT